MQDNYFTNSEKEIISKYTYYNKNLPSVFGADEIIFFNDGYVELDDYDYPLPLEIKLSKKYLSWRYQVSMYKKLLDSADIYHNCKSTIVDVSCGPGGGTSFYRDYYNFDKVIGIDINPLHIDICKKRNNNIDYINTSALRTQLPDESVDIVVSVEAARYYEDMNLFLEEAWRILTPGGKLIISSRDFINMFPYYKNNLFKLISWEDITRNVRTSAAISKYSIQKIDPHNIIACHIEADESVYRNPDIIYYVVVMQKPI